MTASRAHRRGPSPSLARDVHPADDHAPAGRSRPAGAAVTPVAPLIPESRTHLLRTTVPAHPSRASGVRSMVAEYLTRLSVPSESVDNAVLATGELFANAIRHGSRPGAGDSITVTVECTRRDLRVTVADRSSALPRPRTAAGAEESGRGLAIVAALADDWGIAPPEPGTTGKRVWFALALQETR
ncbi:ATP-binding protein [Streptomyces sp. NPDC087263]|uniref:ATP-binding protein n=1 Tax=Streptomyces sp. NPDC087263 TaxID=3365773 RepID=UPI0037F60182